MVGVVLSMFELFLLIASPFVSVWQDKVGRKNFIIIGNICTMLSSIGFGFLTFVESDMLFFGLSLVMRGLGGIGEACTSTTSMAIITLEFTEKKD